MKYDVNKRATREQRGINTRRVTTARDLSESVNSGSAARRAVCNDEFSLVRHYPR